MDDNDKSNSLKVPYHDLYHENSQEQKDYISINVYTQIEDDKTESN